jgi:hypothetical protein
MEMKKNFYCVIKQLRNAYFWLLVKLKLRMSTVATFNQIKEQFIEDIPLFYKDIEGHLNAPSDFFTGLYELIDQSSRGRTHSFKYGDDEYYIHAEILATQKAMLLTTHKATFGPQPADRTDEVINELTVKLWAIDNMNLQGKFTVQGAFGKEEQFNSDHLGKRYAEKFTGYITEMEKKRFNEA